MVSTFPRADSDETSSMTDRDPSLSSPSRDALASTALAGLLGGALCGLWIAYLTLQLNPAFDGKVLDRLMLSLWLGALYAAGGLAAGTALGLSWSLARRALPARVDEHCSVAAVAWGLPVLAALSLPDTGLHSSALTHLLSRGPILQLSAVAVAAAALGVAGAAVRSRLRWSSRRWTLASALASAAVVCVALLTSTDRGAPSEGDLFTAKRDDGRLPLVVLCIDGADPDDVILPLAATGELPTFARLLEEGTFAPLDTLTPTLSPAVWTTLATGKAPEEHGILHFILFDLPFVSTPVSVFPLHTGLNFKIFPLLERLPGVPALQAPYTSELRRSPAVWEIAGVHAPVGSFRWRVTWPVEELNGFAVASDVSLLDQMPGFSESGVDTRDLKLWPEDAYRDTRRLRRKLPTAAEVASYVVDPADEIDLEDAALRPLISGHNRILPIQLTELIAKYRPALTLAGYHSVDGFSHRYWRDRLDGGRFAPAIEERYRFVDEELGTTLAALEESLGAFNLMVVSDHGFDFEAGHHTLAPPGIFFGWGPAFEAGRTLERLHVYDVAPMMLDLVGLPVADDMPGAAPPRGDPSFRSALSAEQRAAHPLRRTPSYGRRELRNLSDTPFEKETLEKLRSLGYIE